jgi:hypothetical protein
MKTKWIVIGLLLLLIGACLAWFFINTPDFLGNMFPADAGIKTGSYWRIQHNYAKPTPVAGSVIRLDIDRAKGLAVFHLQDGSSVQTKLAGKDRVRWAQGCPTMVGSTRMEFLPLAEDRLVLGDATFEHPYLEGTCPAPPVVIVLGEGTSDLDGIADASGCDWYNGAKCIYFGQEYATLHILVTSMASGEELPGASLTLQTPWGTQVYPAYVAIRLPGARFPFTARAPGYPDYRGTIQVDQDVVMVWTDTPDGQPPQASTIVKIVSTDALNLPIYMDHASSAATQPLVSQTAAPIPPSATPSPYPTASPTPASRP